MPSLTLSGAREMKSFVSHGVYVLAIECIIAHIVQASISIVLPVLRDDDHVLDNPPFGVCERVRLSVFLVNYHCMHVLIMK